MSLKEIPLGSLVLGPHNERLGRVCRREDDTFTVRKGRLFPVEIDVKYEDVAETWSGIVRLRRDPTVFSESEATGDSPAETVVTGEEAGYDFAADRPPSQADADTRVHGVEAGIDFGGTRKVS